MYWTNQPKMHAWTRWITPTVKWTWHYWTKIEIVSNDQLDLIESTWKQHGTRLCMSDMLDTLFYYLYWLSVQNTIKTKAWQILKQHRWNGLINQTCSFNKFRSNEMDGCILYLEQARNGGVDGWRRRWYTRSRSGSDCHCHSTSSIAVGSPQRPCATTGAPSAFLSCS